MQIALTFAAFAVLFLTPVQASAAPVDIFYADPTIFTENGRYYLSGTRNAQPPGFAILESDNLREWRAPAAPAPALILQAGADAYGTSRFWAPQLIKENADYVLTYTADEHVALAKSATLTGPYRQTTRVPIDSSERNIDSYLFRDDDGRRYLYHVRFRRGNFLWVGEFDETTGRIKPGTLKPCFSHTEPWETTPSYPSAPIMEGPTVLKLKGKYYLLYSANHYRSIDYAVGYAVADSPFGPWVKPAGNPILHRAIVGENGSGHGDVFRGPHGQLHYVYHVHHSDTQVHPRRTRIVPLIAAWNERQDRFDLSVDAAKVIKPVMVAPPPAP